MIFSRYLMRTWEKEKVIGRTGFKPVARDYVKASLAKTSKDAACQTLKPKILIKFVSR